MNFLHHLAFSFYPYICGSVFVLGCVFRFRRDQYSWQASSSQMMSPKNFRLASNLFHLGVLGLAGGHVAGLLMPAELSHMAGLSESFHQHVELITGSILGTMTIVGLSMLIYRRVTDLRVSRTGNLADLVIAVLLWITVAVGMATLPSSFETRDTGEYLGALSGYVQRVLTFRGGAAELILNVPWAFKFHMFMGMTIFLVFPFTRLVHVVSVPVGYLFRTNYQIVRRARPFARGATEG